MILDLIHHITVMDELLNHKVERTSEWHWFRKLQNYLKRNCLPDQKPAIVRMLECEHKNSFEYQGNGRKSVQTPLSVKCYLTLMHGMDLRYGGVQPTLGRADECHLLELQLMKAAIKTHAKVVSLLGREITVNCNAGIFITMIPAK